MGYVRTPDQLASEAKFLAVGLTCGLVRAEEVGEWADAAFHEQPTPPAWTADVAFAAKAHFLALMSQLNDVVGNGRSERLPPIDLRRLLQRLADAIDARVIVPEVVMVILTLLRANASRQDPLFSELRFEASRFEIRCRRDHSPRTAFANLRTWLETAYSGPESTL